MTATDNPAVLFPSGGEGNNSPVSG